jgi:hypothetical protein
MATIESFLAIVPAELAISFRADATFAYSLNKDAFEGSVINRGNISKTSEELVALWNENNPDDPVEFSAN